MSSKKTHKGTYARVCKWSRLSGFSGLQQAICAWIGIAQARQSTREKSAPYGDTPEDRSEVSLFLPFFCGSRRGFCLLFYKQGCMLLTKKKFSAPGQKLCIGRWLTTGVTAPNMCFNGFHNKVPPELDVYRMNRANGLFNQM